MDIRSFTILWCSLSTDLFVLPVGVSLVEHIFWPSACDLNWTVGQSQKMLLSLLPLYKDTGPLSCQRQPRVLPPVQTSDILRLSAPFSHNLQEPFPDVAFKPTGKGFFVEDWTLNVSYHFS